MSINSMNQDEENYSFLNQGFSTPQIEKDYKFRNLVNPNNGNDKTVASQSNKEDLLRDDETAVRIPSNVDKDNFDQIPFKILIYYSLPSFGKMSCLVLLNIHAMIYYESIGASLTYMSFFVALARGLEILFKPIIAHFSDQLRSKLGRRKPFMILGCGFYGWFLVCLFSPPSMKTGMKNISIWFGVFYVLFFMAETVTNVPYLALGPELSSNSKQRERLYFFFYIFQYIGVLFAATAPVILNRMYSECDCSYCLNNPLILDIEKCISKCNSMCSVKANESSLFYLSLVISVGFVISIILLSLAIQEKSESFNNESMSLIPSLYELLNNKPFLSLIMPWILDVTIMTIFSTMLPFYLNFIINPQKYCQINNIPLTNMYCSVNYWLGTIIGIFFIFCILFCGIWHLIVAKYGKRKSWICCSIFAIIPFFFFLFWDIGSFNLLILSAILTAFPSGGAYLSDVLVSDAIDYDEFYTGRRNEGIFTMCSAFIPKFVSLFAQAVPLSIMELLGFIHSENGYVHTQPPQVRMFIRLFFSVLPVGWSLISILFKLKYPILNDGVMYQVKQCIDLQKDKIAYLKSEGVEFYKIKDPVYERSHINIIIETPQQKETLIVASHFENIDQWHQIYNNQLDSIKAKVFGIIILSIVFGISGFITLIWTFDWLSNDWLSFIPISSLLVVSLCSITICLYGIKLNIISKAISGEYQLDKKTLRLIIFQTLKNEKHSKFKRKDNKIE